MMNKKLLITLLCAGLLIMAVGCNEVHDKEIIVSPRPLSAFTGKFTGDIKVEQLTIIEDEDREIVLQLVPAINSTEEMFTQYEAAYKRNYELMIRLLTDDTEAVNKEKAQLADLYAKPRTLDNVIFSKIIVSGTNFDINAFKRAIEQTAVVEE